VAVVTADEQEIEQVVFNELKAKGEIVASSPLYDSLAPIATAVTRTAQPRYNDPFKYYLVHEQQPNAFVTARGNVYVTDALLYFVQNTERLAGTLCHEVSHTMHHDSMTLIAKERQVERREIGASAQSVRPARPSPAASPDRTDDSAPPARSHSQAAIPS
jgi:predicted Zn-dependent protease